MTERPFYKLTLAATLAFAIALMGLCDAQKSWSQSQGSSVKKPFELPTQPETNQEIPLREAPVENNELPPLPIVASPSLTEAFTATTNTVQNTKTTSEAPIEIPIVAYGVLPVVNDTKSQGAYSDYSFLMANQLAKAIKNQNAINQLNIRVFAPNELEAKARQFGLMTTYQSLMLDYRYQRQPDLDNLQTLINGFQANGVDLQGLFFVDADLDFTHPFGRRGLDHPLNVLFQLPPKDAQYKLSVHAELFKLGLNTTSIWQQEASSWIDHGDLPGPLSSIYYDAQALRYFNVHTQKMCQNLVKQLPLMALTPLATPPKAPSLTTTIANDTGKALRSVLPDYQGVNFPYKDSRNMLWQKTKQGVQSVIKLMPGIIQAPINGGLNFVQSVNAPNQAPTLFRQNSVWAKVQDPNQQAPVKQPTLKPQIPQSNSTQKESIPPNGKNN